MKTLRSPQHKTLIEELRRVRREAGLTQTALADKLGVAQSYVAKVEGAERRLDVVEFVNWLDAANAFDSRAIILERMMAAHVPDS